MIAEAPQLQRSGAIVVTGASRAGGRVKLEVCSCGYASGLLHPDLRVARALEGSPRSASCALAVALESPTASERARQRRKQARETLPRLRSELRYPTARACRPPAPGGSTGAHEHALCKACGQPVFRRMPRPPGAGSPTACRLKAYQPQMGRRQYSRINQDSVVLILPGTLLDVWHLLRVMDGFSRAIVGISAR
ncbi:unnamed protein product [Lota lota]